MSKNAPKASPAPAPTTGITPVSIEAAAAGAANLAGTPAETVAAGTLDPAAPGDGMATAEGAGTLAAPTPIVWPEKARIVSVNAPMLHLYTNIWFDQDSKKVPVASDPWLIAQLEAGKLAISED
jgi:hypothetical protein